MTIQILVVDDSPSERLFIGHFLSAFPDFLVTFASNGEEALQSLIIDQPDVIVSDLRMPVMNGLELVQRLKTIGLNIPVILMTSYGSEQIAVQALEAGAASYVPRKNLETQLIDTLRNVIGVTQKRRERRRTLACLSYCESHFVLENDASSVAPLISHLLDKAASMNLLSGQERTQVGIALQESMSNAIHHGNLELNSELRQVDERIYFELANARRAMAPYSNRRVRVEARLSRDEVRFVIADEGPGFDAAKVADPTAEVNLDRIGGRGLLLINSFMDEVSYNDRGNQITMVKYVASAADDLSNDQQSANCSEIMETVGCW